MTRSTQVITDWDAPTPISISFKDAWFVFAEPVQDAASARSSSGQKLVYRGTYTRKTGACTRSVPAVAIYFDGPATDYARECVGLTMANALGVAPRALEMDCQRPLPYSHGPSGTVVVDELASAQLFPLIVEEDAGVTLHDALLGAPIPLFAGGATREGFVLPSPATPLGKRFCHKILFDVYSQVANLQRRRLYHRDIRSANIALRAYGPNPCDLRATLIDLGYLTGRPTYGVKCASYYDPLFERGPARHAPTPLEQDAGYLAIVRKEVLSGTPAERLGDAGVQEALAAAESHLALNGDRFLARRVSTHDLAREAAAASLPTARELYGHISNRAVEIAEEATLHGGHIDTLDQLTLAEEADMQLEIATIDGLARTIWENYTEHRRRDGLPVEYERFEDQPHDLQESNYAQARHMREHLESLGYDMVFAADCPEQQRVRSLTSTEVELLAEAEHDRWVAERTEAGWTYAPGPKDVEHKTSPYLVTWDELDEGIKDYDRAPMQEMIAVIEQAGLVVRR